jgi:hypothetical protein
MEVVMSEHSFFVGSRSRGEGGLFEVVVGWDEQMQTFFAQVWDITGSADEKDERGRGVEDTLELSAGLEPKEVDTVEELASIVRLFGEMPDDIESMLRDDRAAGLTPLCPL